ncbi:MAG: yccM [Clostridia bacterium]|jgi:uncharacterized protein with FMN-binding domain/NAD-dependent dihydropyrimidine dehydrogenase PreA subunit|nr:yccM [Clostridia bacterium]
MMNIKPNVIRMIRCIVQGLGILFLIMGLFTGYPITKVLLLGITFAMGAVFCGWVCPFGTLQEWLGMLGGKLEIKKRTIPKELKQVLVCLRYVLLIITLLISADFIFSLLSLNPRSNLALFLLGNSLTAAGWIVICIFTLTSLIYKRPFCNYLCIEGAKYGCISALRPITIKRNANNCINCNKCNKVCPMHIDVASHEQVRSMQCISCMECVLTCPVKDTLTVGLMPIKEKNKKAAFPLIAIITFTVIAGIVYSSMHYDSAAAEKSNIITGEAAVAYGDAKGIADGIYTGVGTGFRGEMTVQVTVENELIRAIEITKTTDDAKWLERAYSTVASEIISSQAADVEAVSGATYSSMGIKEAVANALINAGGEHVEAIINDLPKEDRHGKRPRGRHFDGLE